MSFVKAPLGALVMLVTLGCGNTSGTCEHIFEDPVLVITKARSTTGVELDRVVLRAITVDGIAFPNAFLSSDVTFGISIGSERSVHCNLPCGFGTAPGHYEFLVIAQGYQDRMAEIDADFETTRGGCPARSSGSTEVELTLEPSE